MLDYVEISVVVKCSWNAEDHATDNKSAGFVCCASFSQESLVPDVTLDQPRSQRLCLLAVYLVKKYCCIESFLLLCWFTVMVFWLRVLIINGFLVQQN